MCVLHFPLVDPCFLPFAFQSYMPSIFSKRMSLLHVCKASISRCTDLEVACQHITKINCKRKISMLRRHTHIHSHTQIHTHTNTRKFQCYLGLVVLMRMAVKFATHMTKCKSLCKSEQHCPRSKNRHKI